MAALSSIQVEQLEQRVYPDLNAFLAGLTAAALPVFAQPNKEAVLAEIQAETGKSLLLGLDLTEALPFAVSSNYSSISLTHPQEAASLPIQIGAINQQFGYDPELLAVELDYSGSGLDLISGDSFTIDPMSFVITTELLYS